MYRMIEKEIKSVNHTYYLFLLSHIVYIDSITKENDCKNYFSLHLFKQMLRGFSLTVLQESITHFLNHRIIQ